MSIDKRNNNVASTSSANFKRDDFIAIAGQTDFNLSYVLTLNTAVYVNGSLISDKTTYSGFGTKVLKFNAGLLAGDPVTTLY